MNKHSRFTVKKSVNTVLRRKWSWSLLAQTFGPGEHVLLSDNNRLLHCAFINSKGQSATAAIR